MHIEPRAIPGGISFAQDTSSIRVFGPLFLGLIVSYFFWGIQFVQSYYYYGSYWKTDSSRLKAAVCLIFIIDAVQTACISESAWKYIMTSRNDDLEVTKVHSWGIKMLPLTNASTASIVHIIYAHKIWTLLNSPYRYIWTVIVLSLSFLQAAAAIGASATLFAIDATILTIYHADIWALNWLIIASVTDIIITTVMTLKLSSSRTGIKDTDYIISKLIRLIVETGLATSIVQLSGVILYLAWPTQTFCVIPAYMGPKVYSNSMLALLNSRLRPRANEVISTDKGVSINTIILTSMIPAPSTRDFHDTYDT